MKTMKAFFAALGVLATALEETITRGSARIELSSRGVEAVQILPPPPQTDPAVVREIVERRNRGESYGAIARALNEEGHPLPQGGKRWSMGRVHWLSEKSQTARRIRAELEAAADNDNPEGGTT